MRESGRLSGRAGGTGAGGAGAGGGGGGGNATRERLLSVAERLFAEKGVKGTSIRDIAAEAGANLGAINYHFGTKDELARAVIIRRIDPLNAERLRMLDAAEAAAAPPAGNGAPGLEAVLRAFIDPTIRLCTESPAFMKIAGRLQMDPDPELRAYVLGRSAELVMRYQVAVTRELPDTPIEELFWRFSFLAGALFHTWAAADDLEALSGGLCRVDDTRALVDRLVQFGAAGLRAPVVAPAKRATP